MPLEGYRERRAQRRIIADAIEMGCSLLNASCRHRGDGGGKLATSTRYRGDLFLLYFFEEDRIEFRSMARFYRKQLENNRAHDQGCAFMVLHLTMGSYNFVLRYAYPVRA
jgi:hypothetical protein